MARRIPLVVADLFSRPSWPSSESFAAPPPRAHIPSFSSRSLLLRHNSCILHSFRHLPLPSASCPARGLVPCPSPPVYPHLSFRLSVSPPLAPALTDSHTNGFPLHHAACRLDAPAGWRSPSP